MTQVPYTVGRDDRVRAASVAAAGIATRALPRWLAWTALPLGILQLTPIGFQAEIVFWPWAAAAGIYMTIRPDEKVRATLAPAAAGSLATSARSAS